MRDQIKTNLPANFGGVPLSKRRDAKSVRRKLMGADYDECRLHLAACHELAAEFARRLSSPIDTIAEVSK